LLDSSMIRALLLLALLLPWNSIPQARAADPRLALVDSLWSAGQRDSAAALTRRRLVEPRVTGDILLRIDLLTRAGQQNRFFGRPIEGERDLREAVAMAFQVGDSSRAVAALRWLSLVVGYQGRIDESKRLCDSLLAISTAIGDLRHQGWARIGFAWFAGQEGRGEDSIDQYRKATALFRECDDAEGEIWAASGLGRALTSRGRPREALTHHRRAAELASAQGDPVAEANAINDLATIEYSLGDPGIALAMFERALEIHRSSGSIGETVSPAINVALCHTTLEQYADAETVLSETRRLCRERGYQGLAVVVDIHRARLSERRGLLHEAVRRYREILDQGDALSLRNRVNALLGLAEALRKLDDNAGAIVLLEQAAALLSSKEERLQVPLVRGTMAEALLSAGRYDDALRQAELGVVAAKQFGQSPDAVESMASAGRACRALGRPVDARRWFLAAATEWEKQRGVPLDPVWREQRGTIGHVVYSDLASLLIEECDDDSGCGARPAFDRLQAFKARTLRERMLGPGVEAPDSGFSAAKIVTADDLQQQLLRPGEILLDYYLGPRVSYLFAITRNDLCVARLPAAEELQARLVSYYQLVSSPPSSRREVYDPALLDGAARRLAQTLFGDLEDDLRRCETVMVSGDGLLTLLPFEELYSRLTSPVDAARSPSSPRWARIPSASILADLRRAPRKSNPEASKVFVMVGGQSSDGEVLRGSRREARLLERRYRNVDVGSAEVAADSNLAWARSADVVHVAAHLYLDDASPWRSEIRLGPAGAPANLSAARIASVDLSARLAVLSSCSSAGGRVLSGEGVIGVTGAFLSAGVPTVVATLWPVDDATTAMLMERFYERLAQGDPVAGALAAAKETIRSGPTTRAPFYWAGFVVVGEGDATVALRTRQHISPLALAGLWIGLAGLAVAFILPRRGRRSLRRKSATPV
jgi:tetratricopeptide (TPR) repeat protein